MKMFTLPSKPQDKQQIIENGFALYKQSFWLCLPYSFFAALIIYGPQLVLAMFSPDSLNHLEQSTETLGIMVICWLLGLTLVVALLFRLYCLCYSIPSSFLQSLQQALFKLVPLLMLAILYSMIVLGGTMLFIVPGIILSVSLMFSFILLITDNQNVLQTLTASHRLVWGHWWHTMLIISIPLFLNLAVFLIAFIAVFSLFIHSNMTQQVLYLVLLILAVVIQTLFIPFIFSIALTLLHDLRRRTALTGVPHW